MNSLNINTNNKSLVVAGLVVASSLSSASPVLAKEYKLSTYSYKSSEQNTASQLITSGSTVSTAKHTESVTIDEPVQEAVQPLKLALEECPAYIKKSFGMNVTDVSKVFGISRPTAYKYLDGDIPSGDNSKMIEELYLLAELWNSESGGLKLGMEFKRDYHNKSLYNLLVEKDYQRAKKLIVEIAAVVSTRQTRAVKNVDESKHNSFSPDMVRRSIS